MPNAQLHTRLAGARCLLQAADVFAHRGAGLYAVGGCVRDALLSRPITDVDICGSLYGQEAMQAFAQAGCRCTVVNERLGTLLVIGEGGRAEYTAFRAESYAPGGAHRPQRAVLGVDMHSDALRRDFTINALYYDLHTRRLCDPLGGYADLRARTLRTCRDPALTFADDGLRLLRLARFAASLGFEVEAQTFVQARAHAHLVGDVAAERVRDELLRMLSGEGAAVLHALTLLRDTGVLLAAVPELAPCRGVAQRADHHDFDVLNHLLHACACAADVPAVRLAALLHDIGKPAALASCGRMLGHDALGAQLAEDTLTRLRVDKRLRTRVRTLVAAHMYDLDGCTRPARLRRFFVALGEPAAEQWVLLRRADVCGSRREPPAGDPAAKWVQTLRDMRAHQVPWTLSQLAVNGDILTRELGLSGPALGAMLTRLHHWCIDNPARNTGDQLLRYARRIIGGR